MIKKQWERFLNDYTGGIKDKIPPSTLKILEKTFYAGAIAGIATLAGEMDDVKALIASLVLLATIDENVKEIDNHSCLQ